MDATLVVGVSLVTLAVAVIGFYVVLCISFLASPEELVTLKTGSKACSEMKVAQQDSK